MITTELNKQLHALLTSTNLMSAKEDLVGAYTSGRSTSSRDLNNFEAIELIRYLKSVQSTQKLQQLQAQQPHANPNHISNSMPVFKKKIPAEQANAMRKKMIALAHQMGWSSIHPESGKKIADMARLDEWCIKYGHQHKALNAYTLAELPMLVTQFDKFYKGFLKDI